MRTRIAGGSLFHAASFLLRNSSAFNWLKPYNEKRAAKTAALSFYVNLIYTSAKNSLDRVIGSMYLPSLYTRMLPEAISSMSITLPSAS